MGKKYWRKVWFWSTKKQFNNVWLRGNESKLFLIEAHHRTNKRSVSAFINNGALKMKCETVLTKNRNVAANKCARACRIKDHRGKCHSDFWCNEISNITWPFPQEEKRKHWTWFQCNDAESNVGSWCAFEASALFTNHGVWGNHNIHNTMICKKTTLCDAQRWTTINSIVAQIFWPHARALDRWIHNLIGIWIPANHVECQSVDHTLRKKGNWNRSAIVLILPSTNRQRIDLQTVHHDCGQLPPLTRAKILDSLGSDALSSLSTCVMANDDPMETDTPTLETTISTLISETTSPNLDTSQTRTARNPCLASLTFARFYDINAEGSPARCGPPRWRRLTSCEHARYFFDISICTQTWTFTFDLATFRAANNGFANGLPPPWVATALSNRLTSACSLGHCLACGFVGVAPDEPSETACLGGWRPVAMGGWCALPPADRLRGPIACSGPRLAAQNTKPSDDSLRHNQLEHDAVLLLLLCSCVCCCFWRCFGHCFCLHLLLCCFFWLVFAASGSWLLFLLLWVVLLLLQFCSFFLLCRCCSCFRCCFDCFCRCFSCFSCNCRCYCCWATAFIAAFVALDHSFSRCEGGVDVVGVVLPLFSEVRRFCMVIKFSSSVCCQRCMRREKWKRRWRTDRSRRRRWTQRETLMYDYERGWDETQEHLEPWGACDRSSGCDDEDYALSVYAHKLCNLRVSVFVSLYLLFVLFTPPVGDGKLRWLLPNFAAVTFAPNSMWDSCHWFSKVSPAPSVSSPSSRWCLRWGNATRNLAIATKTRKSCATNFGNKLDPLHSWGDARLTTLLWSQGDASWASCRNQQNSNVSTNCYEIRWVLLLLVSGVT